MSTLYRRLFSAFLMIFAVGLIITIPLAVYLILYSIDPSTHFYYDDAKYVSQTNIILVILTVILILPIFFKRAGSAARYAESRRPVLAVFSAILAAALCVCSAYDLKNIVSKNGAGNFLTGLSGILAAIFFFILAYKAFTGKNIDIRISALLPVLWGVINLISTFMSLTQIANISEYLYEVLYMVFAILFLYYNARLVGGVTNKRELNGVFAFGLPCAFYGLLASVPPVIAHLINSTRGNLPKLQYAAYLAMSLYILALLISLIADKAKTQPEKEPEQITE